MPTIDEVKTKIRNLKGLEAFLGRREISELPKILWEHESIENILQGSYNNDHGILVSTNKRLIFIDKGLLYGLKVEDFPFEKITSIQYTTGLIYATLTIFTGGKKSIIRNVSIKRVRDFSDDVREKIFGTQAKSSTSVQQNNSITDQLEKLANLKDRGILTKEEFDSQKKKLLDL